MKDENKTKKQLINELLLELRQRIAELEISEKQHKLLEQVLNEREQKLRNIIEHSNEIFYAHDTHHKLTYISPQSIQILGYSPDEMMTEWTNLITENPTNEMGIEITNKALKTGEKQKPYLLELYGKDGIKVLLEIEESPLKDKDGNVIGIVGAARDITKRKRAEKALIDSEEHYRRMVSAITTYTYSVEVKDGQAIFTRHSIECLPVTGYKPEDYESEPYLWYTMIHPEDQILVGNSLKEILAGREVPPIEHRLIRRDGSIVWVRNTMVPYTDEEGQLIRYDGLIEDITERKRAEEELGAEKNKLQSMIDAMEYGLTIQDLDYNIIYQNEVLRNIFGDRLGEKCYQVYEGKDKICDGCPVE
ncbi:MAG: PAS domain S-box protein, partial [Nitrospirota bacterium]|nr:PAS domain S-box protein [Nitrospirota bacterium]